MRAAFVTRSGGPDVLEIRNTTVPDPGPGELLIRVKAIGLNFADVLARLGVYTGTPKAPFVPGLECAGEVEKIGSGVTSFLGKERVMAITRFGSHAEQVVVPAGQATPIPEGVSYEEGAAFIVNYLSAYHGMVNLANIRRGERMLLHAAAGGVGIASIQLANHLGVVVFGTAGTRQKIELIKSQGVSHAINYRQESFDTRVREITGGEGVDVVMDSVAGRVFEPGWKLLSPLGRYIIYGMAAVVGKGGLNYLRAARHWFAMRRIFPLDLVADNKMIAGFHLGTLDWKHPVLSKGVEELVDLWKRGVFRPVVGETFPFDRIREAHAHLQSRASVGKVVVTIG